MGYMRLCVLFMARRPSQPQSCRNKGRTLEIRFTGARKKLWSFHRSFKANFPGATSNNHDMNQWSHRVPCLPGVTGYLRASACDYHQYDHRVFCTGPHRSRACTHGIQYSTHPQHLRALDIHTYSSLCTRYTAHSCIRSSRASIRKHHPRLVRHYRGLEYLISFLLSRSNLPHGLLIAAFVLTHCVRMRNQTLFRLVHTKHLAAFMLATKYLTDEPWIDTDKNWTRLTRRLFDLQHNISQELATCDALWWHVAIDGRELEPFDDAVVKKHLQGRNFASISPHTLSNAPIREECTIQ